MMWRLFGRSVRTADTILAILSLGIATFLIFQNLSAPAIRIWDEAIYADNALDMYATGDPIVMRRNGELTLYNTKPPFVIWMQTLSLHLFGVNEFAIRFPSALAGVLTCMMLLLFSIITLKDIRIGIVAVLMLGTTYGFVKQHVVKTGDLDAMLVFWVTLYSLVFIHLLLTDGGRKEQMIIWFGVGIAGAFLTKGVAGFIPLMGLGICAVITRQIKWIMSRRVTYIAVVGVVLIVLGFYALREYLAAGYLNRTIQVDYGRFTTNYMSWHHHPWYYYVQNWYQQEFFMPFVFWLPVMTAAALLTAKFRKPALLLCVHVIVFIAILSFPKVKLMWYDAPVYPILGLLCGIGAIVTWDYLRSKLKLHEMTGEIIFVVLLSGAFFYPARAMYQRNANLRLPVDVLEREGFFLRDLYNTKPDLKQFDVLMLAQQNAHYTQVDFYLNAYNRYEGYDITLLRDTLQVQKGDTIACCQAEQIAWLWAHFEVEELEGSEIGCVLVRLVKD